MYFQNFFRKRLALFSLRLDEESLSRPGKTLRANCMISQQFARIENNEALILYKGIFGEK